MFFIGIFGIRQKEKELKTFLDTACPDCGRRGRAALFMRYTYFHVFFIPVAVWNKKYFVRLNCCGALFEADGIYARELRGGDVIDFSRLKRVYGGFENDYTICSACGRTYDGAFSYCPYCGAKR